MKTFQPADHLHSRTFISLLIAQFLAAFNDQAIHASAMFFAINTGTLSEARAITLMPILFYLPWAIFCTVAGYLADRYSKRMSLILWKVIEVGITLLALFGFWLGRNGYPAVGSWVVLSTVFLMGMHSAFFVPAKYGAMPEIFTPRMLSRGNGVLESLSFLAVILGTVVGGILSSGEWYRGNEYMIGVILTVLALIGAMASLFIERIPVANPNRPFPPYIYQPLWKNLREMLTSRPLIFAVVGIAFFTFLVAYMRAVVYMHGQSQLPPWSEARTSEIVGVVALGIGIGSPLVGYLSGGKVEIGLVPIGALGMILATSAAALLLGNVPILIVCIGLIGFFTGFYLVPLFSLLQHRAPKTSKGDFIATSNFINIVGAIASSLIFALVDWSAVRSGFAPALPQVGETRSGKLDHMIEYEEGHPSRVVIDGMVFTASEKKAPYRFFRVDQGLEVNQEVALREYQSGDVSYYRVQPADKPAEPVYNKANLPALLFLSAGGMTLLTLGLLWFLLPDLFLRTRIWMQTRFRYRLEPAGMLRLPGSGPVVLVTDAVGEENRNHVISAADRVIHFLLPAGEQDNIEGLSQEGRKFLDKGKVVGVCLDSNLGGLLLDNILQGGTGPILPVHHLKITKPDRSDVYVIAGTLDDPGTSPERIRHELHHLQDNLARRIASGEPLEKEAAEH